MDVDLVTQTNKYVKEYGEQYRTLIEDCLKWLISRNYFIDVLGYAVDEEGIIEELLTNPLTIMCRDSSTSK